MKCDRCGYNGTWDQAHACVTDRDRADFWGFNTVEDFHKFVESGGIKSKYASGGIVDGVSIIGNGDKEYTSATEQLMKRFNKKALLVGDIGPELNIETKNKIDPNNASRFDSGKVDWSQVPFEALEGMVRVLEFGAKKYSKGNWASGGGFQHSRVFNSLIRHFVSYQSGEDNDKESGLPHIDHMMCNCMFMAFYKKYPEIFDKDDRLKWVSQNV